MKKGEKVEPQRLISRRVVDAVEGESFSRCDILRDLEEIARIVGDERNHSPDVGEPHEEDRRRQGGGEDQDDAERRPRTAVFVGIFAASPVIYPNKRAEVKLFVDVEPLPGHTDWFASEFFNPADAGY